MHSEMGLSCHTAPGKTLHYSVPTWQKMAVAWDLPVNPRDTLEAEVPTAYHPRRWRFPNSFCVTSSDLPPKGGAIVDKSLAAAARKLYPVTSFTILYHRASALLSFPSYCYLFKPFPSSSSPKALVIPCSKPIQFIHHKLPEEESPLSWTGRGCVYLV